MTTTTSTCPLAQAWPGHSAGMLQGCTCTTTSLLLSWYPDPATIAGSIHVQVTVPKCPMFDFGGANGMVPELAALLALGFRINGHMDGEPATARLGSLRKAQQPITLDEVKALHTIRGWAAQGLRPDHHTCPRGPVCQQQASACLDYPVARADHPYERGPGTVGQCCHLPEADHIPDECGHWSCMAITHESCPACLSEAMLP